MKACDYCFSEAETEQIGHYRDSQKDLNLKTRLYVLLMLAAKIPTDSIVKIIGVCQRTAENWSDLYINEGIQGVINNKYKPGQSYLSIHQCNQVVIRVTFENPANIQQVVEYIYKKFNIRYTDDGGRKLLKKYGLKFFRVKTIPAKPPTKAEQPDFIDTYFRLREQRANGSVTLSADGSHLIQQCLPGFCWGSPLFHPVLPTNTGRHRLNISGAYDPVACSFIHLTGEQNINSDRVVEFPDLIAKNYNGFSVSLISDNAPYFKSYKVRKWLQEHNQFNIIYLPCYSPNLNLIERLRRFVKDQLIRSKYYDEYKEFRAKTFQLLNNIQSYSDILKKLITEKSEIIYA